MSAARFPIEFRFQISGTPGRDGVRTLLTALCLCAVSVNIGCAPPGKPTSADVKIEPSQEKDFAQLYNENCAGCHGREGKGSSALGLANPVYLAIASDSTIRNIIASGVRGSLMPAFATSAGGSLSDDQIDILVRDMRARWANPSSVAGLELPPYAVSVSGDRVRGARAYVNFCSSCHGPNGEGSAKGSSIVDGSFLALVSDQDLRTTIIAGRPDIGQPDWRNDSPGKAMTAQEITDVTAWLAGHRTATPGQPYGGEQKSAQAER